MKDVRWTVTALLLMSFLIFVPGIAQESRVEIKGFSFQPQILMVPPGAEVTWINLDSSPHTVSSSDGKFDSGTLQSSQEFKFVFANSGNYSYYCRLHPSMRGLISVAAADASPAIPGQHETARQSIQETPQRALPGWQAVLAFVALLSALLLRKQKGS